MSTYQITDTSDTTITLTKSKAVVGAVIIYGRGGDLGDFKIFAEYLKKDLTAVYGDNIVIANITRKKEFLSFLSLTKFRFKIKELHIFSHAFGTGLALGYKDPSISRERELFVKNDLNNYYETNKFDGLYKKIIELEKGILFIDDLLEASPAIADAVRKIFAPLEAFTKIWGCNSAVEEWIYDYNDTYWGALNYKLNPKPSIAKSFAAFSKVRTFGAVSPSHIEVKVNGKWMTSQDYKNIHHQWPSSAFRHRLEPDSGGFIEKLP